MLRTLIIEDEQYARDELRFLLSRQAGFIRVGDCGSIREANVLLKNTQPDLVLMDVELEDGNAFDLLQSLPEIPFKIIFITAFNEHAIRAIKFGALDYLLKPVDDAELTTALNKVKSTSHSPSVMTRQAGLAREHFQSDPAANRIALRDQYHLRIVAYDDILYCRSDNGYTTFHLTDGRQVLVSRSIKEHERLLPSAVFLRIHQSYIVNSRHVELYHKEGYVLMKNGEQIPVSVRKREEVVRSLTGY